MSDIEFSEFMRAMDILMDTADWFSDDQQETDFWGAQDEPDSQVPN